MSNIRQSYRWVMLALIWLVYVCFGLVIGALAVLITPVVKDLNMSYSQMGLVLGAYQLFLIGSSIFAGNFLDRWGIRKSIMIGLIIITFSACLRYFAQGFGTLYPIVALLGVGAPMITSGGPKVISLWFEDKERGLATGIYATGMSVGLLLGLSLTNSVFMPLFNSSWRYTFLFYGIVVLVISLLWWSFARDKRPTAATVNKMGLFSTLTRIIKIRNIQLVLIIGLTVTAVFSGYFQWLPKILQNAGMSPEAAGFAASASTLASIPATIFFSRLIPRLWRGRAIALAALVYGIALYGLIQTSGLLQYFFLILLGITGAIFLPVMLLILIDNSGIPSEYLGSANGVFMCFAQIGGFLAPYMLGALLDTTGGFTVGILVLAGLNIVIIPIALSLRMKTAS
jgi:MFS transporter, CP family, cyanate transporter